MNTAIQLIGIMGAIFLLIAYWINTSGSASGTSNRYQLLNLFGSLGIVVNAYYFNAYGPLILNVIWFALAARTLFRATKRG